MFKWKHKKLNNELNEMWYDLHWMTKTKLMCWQFFILMNENCWWFKSLFYIHFLKFHQITFFYSSAAFGPSVIHDLSLLSVFALMRWRTVGDAAADCGRGVHAAADRDCKGPWWRKCRFYPPANPWPDELFNNDYWKKNEKNIAWIERE